MGSAQSLLSPEAAITTAVVVGAVGYGIGYQVSKSDSKETEKEKRVVGSELGPVGVEGKAGKGKAKAKKAGSGSASEQGKEATGAGTSASQVVPFPAVVPGQFVDENYNDNDVGSASGNLEASSSAKKGKGKGGKKKNKAGAANETDVNRRSVVEVEQLASSDPGPAPKELKSKKQKKKKAAGTSPVESQSQTQSSQLPSKPKSKSSTPKPSSSLHQSTISVDTDGEWTRVEKKNSRDLQEHLSSLSESTPAPPSDSVSTGDAVTTDGDGDAEDEEEGEEHEGGDVHRQQSSHRRPLAERLLPKPRKTGVDDMLSTPDYATISRVMRVQPKPGEKPAVGFSWGDYEDVVQGPAPSGPLEEVPEVAIIHKNCQPLPFVKTTLNDYIITKVLGTTVNEQAQKYGACYLGRPTFPTVWKGAIYADTASDHHQRQALV